MYRLFCVLLLLVFGSVASAKVIYTGSSEGMVYRVDQVADGLGVPWGLAFLSDHELMFTEREGYISVLNLESRKVERLAGGPHVFVSGQGGMLDVAVPPDFKAGDWIYVTYVKEQDGDGVTVLGRGKREGSRMVEWQDLLVTRSRTDTSRHFGSRIAFDASGHVFFTVGDRGHRPNGQDLNTHAGSVLRLNRDGTVPRDNPFVAQKGALREIWSYGHRNPQGIAYDDANHRLWEIEHGPRGGDEINLIEAGKNYGWPVISYGKEYWGPIAVGEGTHHQGMEQPIKYYVPSIAPGSLLLYTGAAFPQWQGNLFSGALKLTHLNRVVLDARGKAIGEERLLGELGQRIRALAQSPSGEIYLSTDSGLILRLSPVPIAQE